MLKDSKNFTVIDDWSAYPFWISQDQKNIALRVAPLLLCVWLFFLLGFKTEISNLGDEAGYHAGGVLLAKSLWNGTFLQDAFNKDNFKFPGYYVLAGIFYFLFGENQLLLRALGFFPFFGLALVVTNIVSLIAGSRARNFAMLAVLFSPVFISFSLRIYRDIYIVFGIALVLHAFITVTQQNLPLRKIISIYSLLGLGIITMMRSPMLSITLIIVIVSLLLCWTHSLPHKSQLFMFMMVGLFLAGILFFARTQLIDLISQTFLFTKDTELSTTQVTALSGFSFRTPEDMLNALMTPSFLLITIVAKLSGFTLGSHPFLNQNNEVNRSLFELIENFQPSHWGGVLWEDVLLMSGMQWIVHFLLLPFLIAGILGIWRYNRKALFILGTLWITFSIITIFSGNEERWGLPNMIVYYVVTAVGYGMYGMLFKQLFPFYYSFLICVIFARFIGVDVPMIVVFLVTFFVMSRQKISPIGFLEDNVVQPFQSMSVIIRDHTSV